MAGHKKDRTAEDIRREVTSVIRELKDPRVRDGILTVVRVEVSSDASFAKVYISSLDGLDKAKAAVKGLDGAVGYIRREIGGRLGLRKTPELKFIADDSIEHGMGIVSKLNSLSEAAEGKADEA